ncbi:MAG: FAD-dependent oxidoreductase [Kiritimatiellae bacterium]|nr:FAD-dependent oxidoreductase [Kiritimatiellia bacterium]
MAETTPSAWRCSVCGYVHQGAAPPEVCPVCGAAAAEFEPYAQPAAPPTPSRPGHWRCLNCRYVHDGESPPDACPVCGVGPDRFEAALPASAPPAAGRGAGPSGGRDPVVIVGAGIAGLSAAETLRRAAPGTPVTLVSDEPALPYYRLNLTRYLAGEVAADALPVHPRSWYPDNGIELLAGEQVLGLDLPGRTVQLRGARTIRWQKLILAMGAHPFVPPIPGADREGAVGLRNVADADYILAKIGAGAECVCVGGGILGLETAGALAKRGARVTLLESHAWLMPRQLNAKASALFETHVRALGIDVRKAARTAEIAGGRHVAAVVLEDGTRIPAGLVVITTGVRSNTHLARKAALEVNRGIAVDNALRTSAPDVYAAGDVAEHRGVVYGLWSPAQYQGSIAGLNAAGEATTFGGLPRANSLKVLGLDMLSIGTVQPEDGSYRMLEHVSDGRLFQFIFRDGRMAGAVLMGDTAIAPAVKKAVESGLDCSEFLAGARTGADVVARLQAGP